MACFADPNCKAIEVNNCNSFSQKEEFGQCGGTCWHLTGLGVNPNIYGGNCGVTNGNQKGYKRVNFTWEPFKLGAFAMLENKSDDTNIQGVLALHIKSKMFYEKLSGQGQVTGFAMNMNNKPPFTVKRIWMFTEKEFTPEYTYSVAVGKDDSNPRKLIFMRIVHGDGVAHCDSSTVP